MQEQTMTYRLTRRGDRVMLHADGDEPVAVRIVWARPISARGAEISLLDDQKREALMLSGLDDLDADSRAIAEEELAKRYFIPRITRVVSAVANFGIRYWRVETDLGERRFALKQASKNAVWLTDDHLVLRDTLGCRYEIRPYADLDERSRAEVEKVI